MCASTLRASSEGRCRALQSSALRSTMALTAPLAPSAGGVVRYPAVFSYHRPADCMKRPSFLCRRWRS